MSQTFFHEDDMYESESVEVQRSSFEGWLFGLTLFLAFGLGAWFWHQSESRVQVTPVVIGPTPETKPSTGRYILVRQGSRSHLVGGSSVVVQRGQEPTGTARAESFASYTTTDVSQFARQNPDLTRIGQTIAIDGARVSRTAGDKAFTLESDRRTFMVSFPEPERAPFDLATRVVGGDTVNVVGVLKRMPPKNAAKRIFGFSNQEASALTAGKLYLDAYKVVIR